MRVAIGCDHRGVQLKSRLVPMLQQAGHDVLDEGTFNSESVDYPDIACAVARRVSRGDVDRGILICGTGIGMAITANKLPKVRAATCHDEFEAEMCRRHNDVNVLCLSSHLVGERSVDNLVKIWLSTAFEGGRHARRVEKINTLDSAKLCDPPGGQAAGDAS
jgi:ribose 5-phosphate isomerase B